MRRNIAIIAHVDHGKTTLVDALLRESGAVRANQNMAERAMDSFDLERERGITILAKCTSVTWAQTRINIVDTPGHADFGGEVERIFSMVDGVLVLVDAGEGPMPQTKFVTGKALALGLRPIVVINKVDRAEHRAEQALDEIFDLFSALGASERQLDFPYLFASAKEGWAVSDLAAEKAGLRPLFETVLDHVLPPDGDEAAPFTMLVSLLEADPYVGRILTGRVASGTLSANAQIKALRGEGNVVEQGRATKLFTFRGLERVAVERVRTGDIVAVAGLENATVADTLCAPEVRTALVGQPIDPPTLVMTVAVNTSPLAGRDGDKLTSRILKTRLSREAEGNVAIRVNDTDSADVFSVEGRGELQLGVLIETMRREGYELAIGRPHVLFRDDPKTGQRLEPIEEVVIDVDEAYAGVVVESVAERRGSLLEMSPGSKDKTRLVFHAPSRGLIGYHGQFLTETRGTGVLNRVYHGYEAYRGPVAERRNGVLISTAAGKAVAYALWQLEDRGPMFIEPGDPVYQGMIIGEHTRGNDLEVNPLKAKQLTNIRAAGKDDTVRLTPPRLLGLEAAIAYIGGDELVEVTPQAIRLRKRNLDPHERKRAARRAAVDS